MKMLSWPLAPLGIIALGIALFAVPSQVEGRVLVPISPGHALSLLDSFALLPLLIGVAWLYVGSWQRRYRLVNFLRQSPGVSSAVIFTAGAGLGLLIASAFSAFFWWLAIGATLFSVAIIAAIMVAARQ
jgi:hypothetical protein